MEPHYTYSKKIFGQRLKQAIVQNGYTVPQFAEIAKINYRTLMHYIKGDTEPSYDRLKKICAILCVRAGYLLQAEE